MFVSKKMLPLTRVTRHLRTLASVHYQKNISKQHIVYAKEPFKPKHVDLNKQSILLPGPERIRASPLSEDPNIVIETIPGSPEIKTVYDVLGHGLKVSNDGPCIGRKPPGAQKYQWQSYSEFIERTQNVGSGFIQLGLKPENDTFIGIFAANQEESLLSVYACAGYSMVLVPFYMNLGLTTIAYIINHAKLSAVISTNSTNTDMILNNSKSLPTVKTLITCETPTEDQRKVAEAAGINMLLFSEVEEMGKSNRKELVMPNPDDKFAILFTSGTTGIPKGAVMIHKNFITMVASVVYSYGEVGTFGGCIMSYLPPAHAYELCNWVGSMYFARGIAFYGGVIQNLMEDVREVQPTVLPLVPRIMSKIYSEAWKKIKESKTKSALLRLALRQKEKLLKRGKITNDSIWDKFILKEFQALMGGNLHAIPLTSAPVPQDVMRFFSVASGAYVMESYGSTEIMATVLKLPRDLTRGYIGCPMVCNHVKLVDVPEMGYYSKDDTGEICVKGPNVFEGYLDNPEATKEALKDGWFHTGDVGQWLPNGALKIIDRKKHLFKLSQGEYIAPEKIENVYIYCNLVLQILVDGIPEKDYAIALVLPEPTAFKKWLASKGYTKIENMAEVLSSKEIRKDFLLELHHYGNEKHLNSLEQARNIAFLSEPLTIENDLLTPTFKIKRNIARKRFEQIYHRLYEEGPLIASLKS